MAEAPAGAGLVPTNVSVVARLRPLGPLDESSCLSVGSGGGNGNGGGGGGASVVFSGAAGAAGGSNTNNNSGNTSTLTFRFDQVHGTDATQEDIFQHCEPLVDGVFKGLNGTIMAYGQTGSGKTHTLIGAVDGGDDNDDGGGAGSKDAGVVPRACRLLMRRLASKEQQGTTKAAAPAVSMTAVEIYAERVRCLLGGGQNLPLKQDPGGGPGAVRAEGAAEVAVAAGDVASLSAALRRALSQRAVAATEMNSASSRSHCVVTLRLLSTGAKLQLVDLAGSERADRTGAQGAALAEGAAINRSLSALANVVSALAGGAGAGEGGGGVSAAAASEAAAPPQQQHVPYRDSKLTRLLQDSLGGCARTVLVVCCSPGQRDAAETLSSLRFASRARGVKCLVAPVGEAGAAEASAALAAARAEAAALRARLSRAEKGSSSLLPWVLRCASAAVLGAYVAWEGARVV